ncbi:GNAT family acetyltransferase [bacterium]|nr:GNAT family acetyltransferase [bacterium]
MVFQILRYNDSHHRGGVVDLWNEVFQYSAPHNEPGLSIDRKMAVDDGLFLVAVDSNGIVIGTIMGGYDGHRGWIYSLAVEPSHQRMGIGASLLGHVEKMLIALGCLKINLQILPGNEQVQEFYRRFGYATEERINMGKKIDENQ